MESSSPRRPATPPRHSLREALARVHSFSATIQDFGWVRSASL